MPYGYPYVLHISKNVCAMEIAADVELAIPSKICSKKRQRSNEENEILPKKVKQRCLKLTKKTQQTIVKELQEVAFVDILVALLSEDSYT